MILGENRRAVIENIKTSAESGEFYNKVELTDPVLTPEESRAITDAFVENRKHGNFKVKTALALAIAKIAARRLNRDTVIVGLDKVPKDLGGVIITSNHFSPIENTVIRHLTNALGRRDLAIISQTTNFAMKGFLGFLLNYADTIPISADPRYLVRNFLAVLKEKLIDRRSAVLLYPEQEMWFHYRKPRPPKNGAYFYAAKLNVPILSCFVEIVDCEEDETEEFKRTRWVLHVLDLLTPDPEKSVRENTDALAEADYALKKAAYEAAYGKKLTYDFDPSDIAGWKETL